MFAKVERIPLVHQGRSVLAHVGEVLVNTGKDVRRRAVLFTADLRTLASHQRHLEQQRALETPGNATTDTPSTVQPTGKSPISPSLEKYLEEVL